MTKKCSRKCLKNYKGTIFGVAWTEKYLIKDIREKSMENNGDEIAVLFLMDMKQSGLHINHGEFRSSDKLRFACG